MMSGGHETDVVFLPTENRDRISQLEAKLAEVEGRLNLLLAGLRCGLADGGAGQN